MRPEFGQVCQSLIVVSNCIPGIIRHPQRHQQGPQIGEAKPELTIVVGVSVNLWCRVRGVADDNVLGDDAEKARALEGFASAAGFLRTKLARTLTRRTVPELHFEVDRGLDHAARIDALLGRLHMEDPG